MPPNEPDDRRLRDRVAALEDAVDKLTLAELQRNDAADPLVQVIINREGGSR